MTRANLGARLGARVKEATNSDLTTNTEIEVNTKEWIAKDGAKIANFVGKRIGLTRLERKEGSPASLHARFPLSESSDQTIDLSFLLQVPNLANPFAEAYRVWGVGKEPGTRRETAADLRRGIVAFLVGRNPMAGLRELDSATFGAFIEWLNSKETYVSRKVAHPNTRRQRLEALQKLLFVAIKHPAWGDDAASALEVLPNNVYPHADKKSTPRNRLTREHLEAIDAAAQKEVKEIQARIEESKRLLAHGARELELGNRDFSDLGIHLAEISRRYPNALPAYKQLRSESPDLYEWAYRSNKRNQGFGLTFLGDYLYASPRDLVPFVLLLAIEGAFNAESVLMLDIAQVEVVDRIGARSLRVSPPKNRAAEDPTKYLDPVWVQPWFEALEYLTRRLRPMLPPEMRGLVFVYAQRWGEARVPTSFKPGGGKAGRLSWALALNGFIEKHGLPKFTLSQIRPTEGDEVGQAHGSLAASRALNHRKFETTDASYLASGTRSREGEQLSLVVDQMQRWVSSRGAIDTRRSRRTSTMDKGAATPGYDCAEPYDSPRPGQRKDRLCGAYGECPSCELGQAKLDDPASVAYYLELRHAIVAGQELMPPQAWLQKWAPVLLDLNSQIEHIPSDVLNAASRFRVKLPPVG